MSVPWSEIAERSSCHDFARSLVHAQHASALDQLGRLCVCFLETERTRCLCLEVLCAMMLGCSNLYGMQLGRFAFVLGGGLGCA